MTREEFAVLVSAMRTYYQKENLLPNSQAMELWYRQLQDIPYKTAEASLEKWVATSRWSPTIADFREMATGITIGDLPDWGEAWETVLKTVRRYGYNRQIEAMESLPDIIRDAVRRVGWYDICMSENIGVERASFRDIYNNLVERKKKDDQIPRSVANLIGEIRDSLRMIEG